jgi:hypothetical protein
VPAQEACAVQSSSVTNLPLQWVDFSNLLLFSKHTLSIKQCVSVWGAGVQGSMVCLFYMTSTPSTPHSLNARLHVHPLLLVYQLLDYVCIRVLYHKLACPCPLCCWSPCFCTIYKFISL